MASLSNLDFGAAVFVDTAAWIALINSGDALHWPAIQIMKELARRRVRLVTSGFVLMETADALCAPSIRGHTVSFVDGLRRLPALEIVPVSEPLFVEGWELFRQRPDKDWGLTDCTSFALMTVRQIYHAFTSDLHFEQAGFLRLM
jgi:uncharacterized protein